MEESKVFQTATLTTNGRPILHPTEIECQLLSAVDLESQSLSTKSNGLLILTTHRLLWIPPDSSSKPLAIPLSSVTQISPLKKSIKSIFHSPRLRFHLLNQTAVTVVFRGKGDFDSFVEKFWQNWRSRSWESADVGSTSSTAASTTVSSGGGGGRGLYSSDGSVRMVGVSGILRKEQEMWESTDKSLQDAFQDLNALMSKAKEMVSLAEKMRLKLLSNNNAAQQGGNSADEDVSGSNQEIQDWLLSVGFISPVTKESAGALYHQQLARQLADFVSIPLERAGGMINLIDVYCLFNRARGTELISPEDLLQACSLWQKFDVPVMLRKFDSGVMVIQNKSHSDDEVFSRIKTIVSKTDALLSGITASDAAMTLGIAPAMAKEHLLNAESKGLLCRDISPDGFRFYINIFPEIDSSNVHWVKEYSIYAEWIKATSSQ